MGTSVGAWSIWDKKVFKWIAAAIPPNPDLDYDKVLRMWIGGAKFHEPTAYERARGRQVM